jgi:VanZ family protein
MPPKLLTSPWPALLWTVAVFIMLTMDTGSVERIPVIPNLDKLVHAFMFGLLAFLWVYFLGHRGLNAWVSVFLLVTLYGGGMEFYQENFTSREFEWEDIYADAIGALAGAWTGKKVGPYGNRGRNQN